MNKPYTWIVSFSVAPEWVADGFSLTDERAMQMLAGDLSSACISTELKAEVIHAPSAQRIAREQGYDKKDRRSSDVICELIDACPGAKTSPLHSALIASRHLIDSPAFVGTKGDKDDVLRLIDVALEKLSPTAV